jgi:hypothetical protein
LLAHLGSISKRRRAGEQTETSFLAGVPSDAAAVVVYICTPVIVALRGHWLFTMTSLLHKAHPNAPEAMRSHAEAPGNRQGPSTWRQQSAKQPTVRECFGLSNRSVASPRRFSSTQVKPPGTILLQGVDHHLGWDIGERRHWCTFYAGHVRLCSMCRTCIQYWRIQRDIALLITVAGRLHY